MLMDVIQFFKLLPSGVELILIFLFAVALAIVFVYFLLKFIKHFFNHILFVSYLKTSVYFLFIILFLSVSIPFTAFGQRYLEETEIFFKVAYISLLTLFLLQMVLFGSEKLRNYYLTSKDNANKKRKLLTQLKFGRRLALIVITLLGVCSVLMNFEGVKNLGISILTSAAILSVVITVAAQSTLANIFSGFQIAFSEPIRIGDALVVQGELGEVEDISLTYVSLLLWDKRRLILPISFLLKEPYQNWTHVSAELIGSIFLYVDYSLNLAPLRKKLNEILSASPLWNKKVNTLQVSNLTERTMELRVLISANNRNDAWDLRCLVREELIKFIQQNYPDSLPRAREEIISAKNS